jgi:hypothetical protein
MWSYVVLKTNIMATIDQNVTFLSVSAFKNEVGVTKFEVLRNPNTSKLFLAGDNGENYKCEQALDPQKAMKMLVPDEGGLEQACLVNVKPGAEVVATL